MTMFPNKVKLLIQIVIIRIIIINIQQMSIIQTIKNMTIDLIFMFSCKLFIASIIFLDILLYINLRKYNKIKNIF
jgi:hypothetical protein